MSVAEMQVRADAAEASSEALRSAEELLGVKVGRP